MVNKYKSSENIDIYGILTIDKDGEFFRVADVQKVISDRLNHLKNWKDARTDKDNKIEMTKMESTIHILGEMQGVFK